MVKGIKSIAFRFGLPLLGFALIFLLSAAFQRIFTFGFDLTILIIALLIATAWYAGRAPGIFIALVFEGVLIYFAQSKPQTALALDRQIFITINRLALFLSVVLFASARRSAERRLCEQRELLEVTLQSIGDAVIATDPRGTISFANPVTEKLTGWTAAEMVGKPLAEVFKIVNETTRAHVESPFAAIVRDGVTVGLANHTLLIAKNGTEIPIEDSGAPIRDSKGKIVGAIIVFHDVSQRRAAERERERLLNSEQAARQDAETAGRLKDEFLATVSHELRTPLSAILGWSTMLRSNRLGEAEKQRAVEIIDRNARIQGEIIGDLLDISQIITGKFKLEEKRVGINEVVRQTGELLQPLAAAKAINLEVSTDGGSELFVIGDAERLSQIVWNLASNAVKFTPEGGTVQIRAARAGTDSLEITVADNGIGIEEKFLPYVFEHFRQSDASPTRTYGGLGLGLSIVRHLVRLHGGEISAESEGPGHGARFTVRLPRAGEEEVEKGRKGEEEKGREGDEAMAGLG